MSMITSKHLPGRELLVSLVATLSLLMVASPSSGQSLYSGDELVLATTAGDGLGSDWAMRRADEAGDGELVSTADASDQGWAEAIVPGTVLTNLVAQGVLPDPYFDTNNQLERGLIPDLPDVGPEFYTYWFRTSFEVPADFAGERMMLRLDGINYRAEVWMNGQKLGDIDGMFIRGYFDVTDIADRGQANTLAVLVKPLDNPGRPYGKHLRDGAVGENKNGGNGQIGKDVTMLMSTGWDFTSRDGIRDRNTGIWKGVTLYGTGPIDLRNAAIRSDLPLPDLDSADLTAVVEAVNLTDQPQKATLKLKVADTDIEVQKQVELAAGETKELTISPEDDATMTLAHPNIWWPIQKGEQPLYDATMSIAVGEAESDAIATTFGIREITSNLDTPDGSRLFYVNGKPLFIRGSNWIPEAMLKADDRRTRAEVRFTAQTGINMLRQWGGGITESDAFYDECARRGILVWTEFWMTGDTHAPEDEDLYRRNVADTVKRVRGHASQAYWVSSNERQADQVVVITDLLDELDAGHSGYQEASEIKGIHDGSPYKYVHPMRYYHDTASDRGSRINGFNPEYGTAILPMPEVLETFMKPENLWPIDKATWDYMDGGGFHDVTTKYDAAIKQYGESESLEDYVWKAQLSASVSVRGIWECWNEQKLGYGDRYSSGLLWWYHQSPLPQVCGRFWDYTLEPTVALYATADALEPVHAQFDFATNTVSVNNEHYDPLAGYSLKARVLNFDLEEVWSRDIEFDVPGDGVANDVLTLDFDGVSPVHYIKLDVLDDQGDFVSDSFYWRSTSEYNPDGHQGGPCYAGFEPLGDLEDTTVDYSAEPMASDDGLGLSVTVRNTGPNLALMVRVKLAGDDDMPIRPTFYSDNFLTLLPGESRTVELQTPAWALEKQRPTKLVVEGMNLQSSETTLPPTQN